MGDENFERIRMKKEYGRRWRYERDKGKEERGQGMKMRNK
jgi:hypothetical protein